MPLRLRVVAGALLGLVRVCVGQPEIDYHQHLLSPERARLGSLPNAFTARDLVPLLDAAGD
jgi:hypothetical protein